MAEEVRVRLLGTQRQIVPDCFSDLCDLSNVVLLKKHQHLNCQFCFSEADLT